MQIAGRRIHIAGSASGDRDWALIRYAHELVSVLVRELATRGATFSVGIGGEEFVSDDDPTAPAKFFDWTVLASLDEALANGLARPNPQGRLLATVGTSKTEAQIPDGRRGIWDALNGESAVTIAFVEPGWAAGAYRRNRLSQLGDMLIVLGGGEGVEHLAQLYVLAQKPVIALDLDLGAGSDDGSGGAKRLAADCLANPKSFFRLIDPRAAGTLLMNLSTREATKPIVDVTMAVVRLIEALAPPTAFYVRLLNRDIEDFAAVERFFRNVVDPVTIGYGYEPLEVGQGANEYAWMNEAIFDGLHHAAVAVVDLTGIRNNCFMELGYALGNAQRVILTAQGGTRPPFDATMIEHYAWSDSAVDAERIVEFRSHWERNIDRPPIVRPRSVV